MAKKTIFTAALATALAACGGGGSDAPPPATTTQQAAVQSPVGLWIGQTDKGRNVTGVVLGDGTYYMLYTPSGSTTVTGVLLGSGSQTGSAFSSTDGKDFNFEGAGVNSATVTATAVTKGTFGGSIAYASGQPSHFSLTYSADFEKVPTSAAVTGTYTGRVVTSQGYEDASVAVSPDGTLSGLSAGGCEVSGQANPRTDGNVYDLRITFGSACYFAGQTFTGIAYYDSTARRIYGAAPNASRTDGVLFIGTKS